MANHSHEKGAMRVKVVGLKDPPESRACFFFKDRHLYMGMGPPALPALLEIEYFSLI